MSRGVAVDACIIRERFKGTARLMGNSTCGDDRTKTQPAKSSKASFTTPTLRWPFTVAGCGR